MYNFVQFCVQLVVFICVAEWDQCIRGPREGRTG